MDNAAVFFAVIFLDENYIPHQSHSSRKHALFFLETGDYPELGNRANGFSDQLLLW